MCKVHSTLRNATTLYTERLLQAKKMKHTNYQCVIS
jgi:hypothetical protein